MGDGLKKFCAGESSVFSRFNKKKIGATTTFTALLLRTKRAP
jgi:hypothetical protein